MIEIALGVFFGLLLFRYFGAILAWSFAGWLMLAPPIGRLLKAISLPLIPLGMAIGFAIGLPEGGASPATYGAIGGACGAALALASHTAGRFMLWSSGVRALAKKLEPPT